MATDTSDIVKQGYVRLKSPTVGIWLKRWIILRRGSSKGPPRLEKFLDEKCAKSNLNVKMCLLTNVFHVQRLPHSCRKHAFRIEFTDGNVKNFSTDSDLEADSWVKLLIQECVAPPIGIASGEPDVLSPGIQKELEEQFHVYLMPTPKLDIFGECLLQVTHENIYLWDVTNTKVKLVAWPLTALRRYGSDPTKFTFEAGRHCATGEGMFVFQTLEGEQIYRKVHQATLAIAEAHQKSRRLPSISSSSSCQSPNFISDGSSSTKPVPLNCPRSSSFYGLLKDGQVIDHNSLNRSSRSSTSYNVRTNNNNKRSSDDVNLNDTNDSHSTHQRSNRNSLSNNESDHQGTNSTTTTTTIKITSTSTSLDLKNRVHNSFVRHHTTTQNHCHNQDGNDSEEEEEERHQLKEQDDEHDEEEDNQRNNKQEKNNYSSLKLHPLESSSSNASSASSIIDSVQLAGLKLDQPRSRQPLLRCSSLVPTP